MDRKILFFEGRKHNIETEGFLRCNLNMVKKIKDQKKKKKSKTYFCHECFSCKALLGNRWHMQIQEWRGTLLPSPLFIKIEAVFVIPIILTDGEWAAIKPWREPPPTHGNRALCPASPRPQSIGCRERANTHWVRFCVLRIVWDALHMLFHFLFITAINLYSHFRGDLSRFEEADFSKPQTWLV